MYAESYNTQLPKFRKVRNAFIIRVEYLFFLELLNNEVEGTTLQDERSQVRFSLVLIGIFVDLTFWSWNYFFFNFSTPVHKM